MLLNLFLFATTTVSSFDETHTQNTFHVQEESIIRKKEDEIFSEYKAIPLQVPITDKNYSAFFKYAASHVGEETSDCALFVNRILRARFGIITYGNAWDMQAKEENKKHLPFVWSIPKDEVFRENNFNFPWGQFSKRVDHFRELYSVLEKQENPIGVLGFVYKYSAYKKVLQEYPFILPQTHIAFISGKKDFIITNKDNIPKKIEEILVEKHGIIKSYEWDFVNERVPLNFVLEPEESYSYTDYLVEEHFRKTISGSLLELFLRKHRNNRVEEILRPISFSQISEEIKKQLDQQQRILEHEKLSLVPSEEFYKSIWGKDKQWIKYIQEKLKIQNPKREFFLPIPKK